MLQKIIFVQQEKIEYECKSYLKHDQCKNCSNLISLKLLQVPSDWECSMNWDVRLNSCEKGKSEEWVEASNEMVRNTQKCSKGDQMHFNAKIQMPLMYHLNKAVKV